MWGIETFLLQVEKWKTGKVRMTRARIACLLIKWRDVAALSF